jgi:phosphoribosyl 1,2-cyclic phosphodiesterase
MNLSVIGTGSSGNAYLLECEGDSLLIEAGLRWKAIIAELPNGTRGIKACLITHEHKDHCKAVEQVAGHGIKTIMSEGTFREIYKGRDLQLSPVSNVRICKVGDVMQFPPFTVMAIQAVHDAAEPLAFLIRHDGTGETILYATDTCVLPNRYPGVHYWLVECNYTMQLAETLLDIPEKAPLYGRLLRSHMSLERLLEAFESNDMQTARTIVLLHISRERGDPPFMQETVQRETGITTIAARNGMKIKLGDCPF